MVLTSTSSKVYHSSIGVCVIVPRPKLKAVLVDGVCNKLSYGYGTCGDVWIDKLVGDFDFYIVELGCGTLLKFDTDKLMDDDGRRYIADLEDAIVLDALPSEYDTSHLKPFVF